MLYTLVLCYDKRCVGNGNCWRIKKPGRKAGFPKKEEKMNMPLVLVKYLTQRPKLITSDYLNITYDPTLYPTITVRKLYDNQLGLFYFQLQQMLFDCSGE